MVKRKIPTFNEIKNWFSSGNADVSVNSLEATNNITDPQGNTLTDLSDPISVTDETVTFAESNINITHSGTVINSGSVMLGEKDGTVAVTVSGADNYLRDLTDPHGLIVKPNIDIIGISFDFITGTDTGNTLSVTDLSTNTEIFNTNFSGSSYQINEQFSSGTEYRITIEDSGGGYFQVGAANFTYPETTQDIDVVDGYANGRSSTYAYALKNITPIKEPSSGNVKVEWDRGTPTDAESWDLATYQETLDGESVTVDVEDSTGTVLKSDISENADISDLSTLKDLQLRATLSRSDTNNSPKVDYMARRFIR